MAYNFPDSPTNGNIVQTAGQEFKWNASLSRWEWQGAVVLNSPGGVIVPGTNTWTDAVSTPTTLTSAGCVELSTDNVTFSVGTISVSTGTTFYTRWNTGATCDDPVNNLGATITGTVTDNGNGAVQSYSKVVATNPWATTPTAPTVADGVTTSSFTYGEGAGNATSTGCIEFDVNGSGSFGQGPVAVATSDTIRTRWIYTAGSGTCADSAHNTTITGTFQNDSGQVENFSLVIDKVADAFTFSPATSNEPPSLATSTTPSFTLAGTNAPTSIWAALSTDSGGVAPATAEFSVDGGTTYTALAAAPGTDYVNPGATIQVKFVTGDTVGSTDTLTVSVGPDLANKQDGTYTVTVSKPAFANVTNFPTIADGTTTASTTWANGATTINSTGCIEFSVDGGTTFTQAGTSITDGTALLTRWKTGTGVGTTCSQAPHGTTITGSIENATNADNASLLIDRVPSAYDFTDIAGAAISTQATSNTVTISGINACGYLQWVPDATNPLTTVQASVNGGTYTAVPALGTYTLKVEPGETITVQGTTGASAPIGYTGTFYIGDGSGYATDTWTVNAVLTPSITTPTIDSPVSGSTGLVPDISAVGSNYAPVNSPGPHTSSDWEVYEGGYPLTSTNTITGVTTNASYLSTVAALAGNAMGVTWDNSAGRFYAAGQAGDAWISTDGSTWTAFASNHTKSFLRVADNDSGTLVGISGESNDLMFYSTDGGSTWTSCTISTGNTNSKHSTLLWNGSRFVMSSKETSNLYTSTDGITFTRSSTRPWNSNSGSNRFETMVWDPNSGRIIGTRGTGTNTPRLAWTSDYGETWTTSNNMNSYASGKVSVAGSYLFFGVEDGSQRASYSLDGGTTFVSIISQFSSYPKYFWEQSGVYYALLNNNTVVTTTDPTNWTGATAISGLTLDANRTCEIAQSPNGDIAISTENERGPGVDFASSAATTSVLTIAGAQTDGFKVGDIIDDCGGDATASNVTAIDDTNITVLGTASGFTSGENVCRATSSYTQVVNSVGDTSNLETYTLTTVEASAGKSYYSRVKYNDDGSTGSTVSSDFSGYNEFATNSSFDPDTWIPASATSNEIWHGVEYGNGMFVAVAQSGANRAMYSTDGINWTASAAVELNTWRGIAYGNGKFVAASEDGTNQVMYSTDGINWTPTSATRTAEWYDVAYGNGMFVAIARDATGPFMYSSDGINWTGGGSSLPNDWIAVTYGNGKFVAVSQSGTNRVAYSTDGINWSQASEAETNQWYGVAYGNGKFVAVSLDGTNQVMYSTDGISWTSATAVGSTSWESLVFANGTFVAVGGNSSSTTNQIMYSSDGINWTGATETEITDWRSITYGNGKFVAISRGGTNQVMYSYA